ncbi:MAG: aminotransferase class III-fold pyridoxal phosphate-dependent enzyme [Candidatus Pacebacteria bacterium]|nr:aminotransferase class III-fold pyridoxal phosphate-dependent enzyme [Candidatus Paceibacterota bacterium]
MAKKLSKQTQQEKEFLEKLFNESTKKVTSQYLKFSKTTVSEAKDFELLEPLFLLQKENFFNGLSDSLNLAKNAQSKTRLETKRISYHNKEMKKFLVMLENTFPQAGNIWVLNGLVFKRQVAGLKDLTGFNNKEGLIIDVLNSAASLSLGAQNPWLTKMDYLEDLLEVRDNICAAYHPGVRQVFTLKKLANLYPNKNVKDVVVHTESSGSVVDSIAIESASAFAEKQLGNVNNKVLAVNGTWAGGYGSAREGSGFGVDNQQVKKAGKNTWVDRCLPAPIKKNRKIFLDLLKEKLSNQKVAGIYLEPDVVGDLGLFSVDKQLLEAVKKLMLKHNLPIILDCVQQLGRSGSYWGENVDQVFNDYPLLILTTAKSASNGQPFGFVLMPKEIGDCAYPVSQITTNQMNGPLLRSLVVAEILSNKLFQKWLQKKSKDIEKVALKYGFQKNNLGLRGKYLNRGIYVGNNDLVKLVQLTLFIEDGILVGATPNSIRYQPMLLEYSETNLYVAETIFRKVKLVKEGKVSSEVESIYKKMNNTVSGLARDNI